MDLVLFLTFALIAVACALNMALQRHPVSSALSLIGVMVSLAVLYVLLGAEFIAAAQLVVYSGAIMVLFIFVIMLLNAGAEKLTRKAGTAQFLGFPLLDALHAIRLPVRGGIGAAARRDGRRSSAHDQGRQMNSINFLVALSAVLFSIGVLGVLTRRNAILIFMWVELMLNAVNLAFVALAKRNADIGGQTTVFFVMVVAAAEVVVGLGIIVAILRRRPNATTDDLAELKG